MGRDLRELNEKLKGFAEREGLENEKLKSMESELEALRKKEDLAKKAHNEREKLLSQAKKLQANLLLMNDIKYKISEFEASIRNLAEKIGLL